MRVVKTYFWIAEHSRISSPDLELSWAVEIIILSFLAGLGTSVSQCLPSFLPRYLLIADSGKSQSISKLKRSLDLYPRPKAFRLNTICRHRGHEKCSVASTWSLMCARVKNSPWIMYAWMKLQRQAPRAKNWDLNRKENRVRSGLFTKKNRRQNM